MDYEIRILGHLSSQWQEWFGDLTIINNEQGETVITGRFTDKAALYGVLNQIQALNLSLISVTAQQKSPLDE